MAESTGFVKFVADAKTDALLGAHMIGPNVSELISEVVLAFEYGGSSEDVGITGVPFYMANRRVGLSGAVVVGGTAITVGDHGVYGLDPASGAARWNIARSGGSPIAMPADDTIDEVGPRAFQTHRANLAAQVAGCVGQIVTVDEVTHGERKS